MGLSRITPATFGIDPFASYFIVFESCEKSENTQASYAYAISTRDDHYQPLPIDYLDGRIKGILTHAANTPDCTFFMSGICDEAGYDSATISPMFRDAIWIPNVYLEEWVWDGMETAAGEIKDYCYESMEPSRDIPQMVADLFEEVYDKFGYPEDREYPPSEEDAGEFMNIISPLAEVMGPGMEVASRRLAVLYKLLELYRK